MEKGEITPTLSGFNWLEAGREQPDMPMTYDTVTMNNDSRRVFTFVTSGTNRAQQAWRVAARQPGWITRLTALTFLIVIGVPILLLLLLALVASAIIFGVLVFFNGLMMRLRGVTPKRDGRRNVRVIQRSERR